MPKHLPLLAASYALSDCSSPSVMDDIMDGHGSARHAFAAGDYENALVMSDAEGDKELFACALVMCGAIDRGLTALDDIDASSDEALVCRAYGHWWRNNSDLASEFLGRAEAGRWGRGAAALNSILRRRPLNVLMLTPKSIQPIEDDTVNVHIVVVDELSWTVSVEELLPAGFEPDIILSDTAVNMHLPAGIFDLGATTIFYATDFDSDLVDQYADFNRADVVLCGTSHEREMLSRLYRTRVISFPDFMHHRDRISFVDRTTPKEWDVVMTGNWFMPHISGKACFAYQLATKTDPSLKIRIYDGYLDADVYGSLLSRSRLAPTNVRYAGGFQSRMIDALRRGVMPLVAYDRTARLLLEKSAFMIGTYVEDDLAGNLKMSLSESADATVAYNENPEVLRSEIDSIFPASPEREIRFVKYALVQSIFTGPCAAEPTAERKIKRRMPSRWQFVPGNPDFPIGHFINLAKDNTCSRRDLVVITSGLVHYYCERSNVGVAESAQPALMAYEVAVARFPKSIALRFNRACFNWMLGNYDQALVDFQWLEQSITEGELDLTQEALLPHSIRGFHDFMPYEIYFYTMIDDVQSGRNGGPRAQAVILATTLLYIAMNLLKNDNLVDGIQYLRRTLEMCPDHYPATRQLTKALWRMEDGESLHWFYRTIDMYPPYLSELLPFGVDMEKRSGNDEGALKLVRNWALFISRVEWPKPDSHHIPEDTITAAAPYIDRLEPEIRHMVNDKLARLT